MKVSYYTTEYMPKSYSPLYVGDCKDVVFKQLELPDQEKVKAGAMFPFANVVFYPVEDYELRNMMTDGALFVDIDHLSVEQCAILCDNFDDMVSSGRFPFLAGLWISHSGKGVHIIVKTRPLKPVEYTREAIKVNVYLFTAFNKLYGLGLNALDFESKKDTIDSHQFSVSHRFFFNHPKNSRIYWNDNATVMDIPEDEAFFTALETLPQCKRKWKSINREKTRDYPVKITGIAAFIPTDNVPHLSHLDRLRLYSSLMSFYRGEELDDIWFDCMSRMPSGKHSLDFYLDEPRKNNWKNLKPYPDSCLLLKFGYVLDARGMYEAENKSLREKLHDQESLPDEVVKKMLDNYLL